MKVLVSVAFWILASMWLRLGFCAESHIVDQRFLSDEQNGRDWAAYGRTFSEDHFSPLDQINRSNVAKLGLAWSLDLDVLQRADAQPLEVDGVVYVAAGLSIVQAIDVRTGKRLWRYDPEVFKRATIKLRPSWGIRGLAFWKGRIYVGTQDGRLISLDAHSGKLEWSVLTVDPNDARTITGAPRVFGDKVIIGHAGADFGPIRGYVTCYDARTGKRLWRFYTVPGNPADGFENPAMAMAAKTWSGEWWKNGGGGTVWNAMTYDPDFNRIYIGTGNGQPWNPKVRSPAGGDCLFISSIVALNADTGEYVWHFQTTPNEAWDYDAVMDMTLATLEIDGRPRKVLMQAPKNGYFYVIDRETGKLISARKLGTTTWASQVDQATGRPIEQEGARYQDGFSLVWPSDYGVHNWPPMSFSPRTTLVYIPTIDAQGSYGDIGIDLQHYQSPSGQWTFALSEINSRIPLDEPGSSIVAWDPVKQTAAWRVMTPGGWNGGTMATAGDLVFQGQIDGHVSAYDAHSGIKLWSYNAAVSATGAPISYEVGGVQYISILTGPLSGPAVGMSNSPSFGWQYKMHPRRILTFSLNATAQLEPSAPAHPGAVPAIANTAFKVDVQLAAEGENIFNIKCIGCHGPGGASGAAAPSLPASSIVLSKEAFISVVRDGALLAHGMPSFAEIDASDLERIRHYIRGVAEGVYGPHAAAVAQ
jgi:quinohemoprotein ethanol dehydrogenase